MFVNLLKRVLNEFLLQWLMLIPLIVGYLIMRFHSWIYNYVLIGSEERFWFNWRYCCCNKRSLQRTVLYALVIKVEVRFITTCFFRWFNPSQLSHLYFHLGLELLFLRYLPDFYLINKVVHENHTTIEKTTIVLLLININLVGEWC